MFLRVNGCWRVQVRTLLRCPVAYDELTISGSGSMPHHATSPASDPATAVFASVPERSSGDHLMRLLQQHHVQLSTMADTKANIIITVSSIVLTLALGRAADPDYRLAMAVLSVFTLAALLLAILAVLPKYRRMAGAEGARPAGFNILFFGHFSGLDEAAYLRELA